MKSRSITIKVDGITFLSTGKYYDGINRWVAHKIKEGDSDAIEYAAKQMGLILPGNSVLIPIPGHLGYPKETMALAEAISRNTRHPIADILRGNKRESQYEAKYRGYTLSQEEMGFERIASIPDGKQPVLIDNVVDTGTTAKAAFKALGSGIVLSYAMSDTLLDKPLFRGIRL